MIVIQLRNQQFGSGLVSGAFSPNRVDKGDSASLRVLQIRSFDWQIRTMILEILPRDFGVDLVDSGGLEILTLFSDVSVKFLSKCCKQLLHFFVRFFILRKRVGLCLFFWRS